MVSTTELVAEGNACFLEVLALFVETLALSIDMRQLSYRIFGSKTSNTPARPAPHSERGVTSMTPRSELLQLAREAMVCNRRWDERLSSIPDALELSSVDSRTTLHSGTRAAVPIVVDHMDRTQAAEP